MAFKSKLIGHKRIEGEGSDHREKLRMLVSGVYVMHEPDEGRRAEMDIVFFHGLQIGDYKKAYEKTWESTTASGAKVCWPCEWLGQDFPSARILSISYDSSMLGSERAGKQPIFSLVKGLLDKLMNLVKIGDGRPVVFVGHSLGGLIVKRLCVEMRQNSIDSEGHKALLENIRGVFFYATPHGGCSFADLALGTMGKLIEFSPVMHFLATKELANVVQLNNDFFHVWNYTKCRTKALAETKPTYYRGKVVVDLISSSQNAIINVVPIDDADHLTICKPPAKNAETYLHLKDFIEGVIKLDAKGGTRYPEILVEAIRSQGADMHTTLHYINKSLQGKEKKVQDELEKATQLATDLVNRGALPCIVEVMQGLRTGQHGAAVVRDAGWAMDNMLEYGNDSFFAKAVDAGAIDALVGMLANDKTAPSAAYVLRNLTDEYLPSHALLARLEAHAKPSLLRLTHSHQLDDDVRKVSNIILTTMDWTPGGESSGSYLFPNEPIIEEA